MLGKPSGQGMGVASESRGQPPASLEQEDLNPSVLQPQGTESANEHVSLEADLSPVEPPGKYPALTDTLIAGFRGPPPQP